MLLFVLIVILLSLIFTPGLIRKSKIKKAINKVDSALESGLIEENDAEVLKENLLLGQWLNSIDFYLSKYVEFKKKKEGLIQKYDLETAQRILICDYWLGMTEEQLIESKGSPDKIEKQVTSIQTTRVTYIYGNKTSGEYFVLENGILTKFVTR
jgi:hypothetical protein